MRPPNSPDPVSNTRLAAALAKARDGGVPKSAIENCLARVCYLLLPYSLLAADHDGRQEQRQMARAKRSCMRRSQRGEKRA